MEQTFYKEKNKIMQGSNVNFSPFVRTKMYLYVFLCLQLRSKLCGNFNPTQATHYKSHPVKGRKRKETGEVRIRWGWQNVGSVSHNQNYKDDAIAFSVATKGGCDEKLC